MKIGIVCYPTFGGSGVMATELGKALARKGHEIHFVTYKLPARLSHFEENIYFHEVMSFEYPLFEHSTYDTELTSKLVDVVKFQKLDLLHVHYAIPHAAVAFMAKSILAAQGIHLPVITTLHGTDITLVGADKSFSPVVEFSINQSDGVTAVSSFLREKTYELFDIEKDIEVIPNFIDFSRFNKTNKDHFKKAIAPNGERIVLHVSNFRKVKRVEDVVSVFAGIQKVLPAKLLMIGDGPERAFTEAKVRECDLREHVRFLGKQEAVEEILSIGDLFILPSEQESFGLAALEAMACKVPVISSNAGGLSEVNIHGSSGYVSDIGAVKEMSENALKILFSEDELKRFREGAFAQAQKFDLVHVLRMYEQYYETITS